MNEDDNDEPKWKIIDQCLMYYNQEEDKIKYTKLKKEYLKALSKKHGKNEILNEIENYSEKQIEDLLKTFFPLQVSDNIYYNFVARLNLSQCYNDKELLEFFNKKKIFQFMHYIKLHLNIFVN